MSGRSKINNKLGEALEMEAALGEMGATQNRNGMFRRYDSHSLARLKINKTRCRLVYFRQSGDVFTAQMVAGHHHSGLATMDPCAR